MLALYFTYFDEYDILVKLPIEPVLKLNNINRAYAITQSLIGARLALNSNITYLDTQSLASLEQEMRQRQKSLAKETEALSQGEKLLARQRYQFGQGWPQTSMVEAAYIDFETILGRRWVLVCLLFFSICR